MAAVGLQNFSWDRMAAAVDAVREGACRVTEALEQAGVPHAVIGGHAVAAWVARVDAEAVRNTKDVDLLLRRADLDRAVAAVAAVGFIHRNLNGIDLFLDGPDGSVRSAVHLGFAGEKVRSDYACPAPDLSESEAGPLFCIIGLEPLVRMKLTSFRLNDHVHLMDLLDVGLIDESWVARFHTELATRIANSD